MPRADPESLGRVASGHSARPRRTARARSRCDRSLDELAVSRSSSAVSQRDGRIKKAAGPGAIQAASMFRSIPSQFTRDASFSRFDQPCGLLPQRPNFRCCWWPGLRKSIELSSGCPEKPGHPMVTAHAASHLWCCLESNQLVLQISRAEHQLILETQSG